MRAVRAVLITRLTKLAKKTDGIVDAVAKGDEIKTVRGLVVR